MSTKQLNREDKRALNALIKKRNKSLLDVVGEDTQKLWSKADKTLGWIYGEPITLPNGAKVDLSMMDFIISKCDFTPDDMTSDLKMIQRFWITLYPHISKMTDNMNFYIGKFREMEKIETEVLKKYADQNLELQYLRKFMKEVVPAEYGEQFEAYHAEKKAESDAEIEKIKEREKEFQKQQEVKVEKAQNRSKLKRFADKILS